MTTEELVDSLREDVRDLAMRISVYGDQIKSFERRYGDFERSANERIRWQVEAVLQDLLRRVDTRDKNAKQVLVDLLEEMDI